MSIQTDHRRRGLATALLLTIGLASITGCGSSKTSGTSADPAGAIPALTPLYAGATVRPDGSLKTAAAAAGRTLSHQADPYLRLLTALQTPGSAPLDFGRDVAPWLGPRAGIFLSSLGASGESSASQLLALLARGLLGGSTTTSAFPFGAHGADGAIVLDIRDGTRARAFLASQARLAGAHANAYRGVAYQVTSEGIAFALVGRFAVLGSESALHSVIDTTLGGPALVRAAGYAKLLALAPSGVLAHVYVNPGASGSSSASGASGGSGASGASGSSGALTSPGAPQGLAALLGLFAGTREANISLIPSATSIELDADALAPGSTSGARGDGGLLGSGSEGAQAAAELPGGSWLALGLGHVGTTLSGDVVGLRGLASLAGSLGGSGAEGAASSGFSLKSLLEGILTPLGLLGADTPEARRDFQSWMGSAGIFASGSGLVDLKAGIVIASTNPSRSRAAVGKLAALLSGSGGSAQAASIPGTEAAAEVGFAGLPITLDIAAGRDAKGQAKFVLGLSEAGVTAALNPTSTLSSAASYTAAKATLGEGVQPSMTVDFPTFLGLLEGVGLSEDPTISRFVPYLRTLTTLSGGEKSLGGGAERLRLIVGLQQTG